MFLLLYLNHQVPQQVHPFSSKCPPRLHWYLVRPRCLVVLHLPQCALHLHSCHSYCQSLVWCSILMLLSWILIQQVFKILLPSFPHSLLIPQHHPTFIFHLLHMADVFCCFIPVLCYPINLLLSYKSSSSTVSSSSYGSLAASALATATALLASFFFLWYSTLSAYSLVCSHRFFNSFFSFGTSLYFIFPPPLLPLCSRFS